MIRNREQYLFNQEYYQSESTKFLSKIMEDNLLWHSFGIRPRQGKDLSVRERVVYLLYAQAKINVEKEIQEEHERKINRNAKKARLRG